MFDRPYPIRTNKGIFEKCQKPHKLYWKNVTAIKNTYKVLIQCKCFSALFVLLYHCNTVTGQIVKPSATFLLINSIGDK